MLLSTIYQVKCFIDRSFLLKKQPENVDVPTVSTPMTTVQQQADQETLPPVTGAGTVQGIAIFYALPVVEYHVEMK